MRDAAKGEAWRAKGAEVAVASLDDAGALATALKGAQGAYLLLPPNMGAPDFAAYQRATGAAIVDAVTRSGVPHVVFLSSIGAQHAAGTGPIKGLHPVEVGLRGIKGTASTLLRAAYFMENLGGNLGALEQGVLPLFHDPALPIEMVATRDIGTTAAQALREGATQTTVIELAGPKKYSFDDVAAALSTIVGRPVKTHNAGLDALVPTLTGYGMPAQVAEGYREMTAGLASGHVGFEGTHRTVRGPTDVEAVLRALLKK